MGICIGAKNVTLKIILVNILLFMSEQIVTVEYDKENNDDQYHIVVSVVIGGGAQYFLRNWKYSMAACLSVGLAKEVYDQVDYGGFSKKDLAKDAIGCTMGVLASSYIRPNDKNKTNDLAFSFSSTGAYLKYKYSF